MGTNYYRIPTEEEMEARKETLSLMIERMTLSPKNIEKEFKTIYREGVWESFSPWDIFLENTAVHLGKRSGGWVFAWDHNDWKYFEKTRESLFDFIKSGRIVDEYGTEIAPDDFIKMALEWWPEGMTNVKYYNEQLSKGKRLPSPERYEDIVIEGLRFINDTNFS
jgi:hypothetical protein